MNKNGSYGSMVAWVLVAGKADAGCKLIDKKEGESGGE